MYILLIILLVMLKTDFLLNPSNTHTLIFKSLSDRIHMSNELLTIWKNDLLNSGVDQFVFVTTF